MNPKPGFSLKLWCWLCLGFLAGFAHAGAIIPLTPQTAAISWAFDFDDNLMVLPTLLPLWSPSRHTERAVSTADWALMRKQIGKPGPWAEYRVRSSDKYGTSRFVGDGMGDGINWFLHDVKLVVDEAPATWQGPMWSTFVSVMGNPVTEASATIITGRHHAPKTMLDGFEYLKGKGLIGDTPKEGNIFPVGDPAFSRRLGGSIDNASGAKAIVMGDLLDAIEAQPLPADMPEVDDPAGHGKGKFHLWNFSDDDYGNIEAAVSTLSREVKAGKWKDIKISISFTGLNRSDMKPNTVILTPNGGSRRALPSEVGEGVRIASSLRGA